MEGRPGGHNEGGSDAEAVSRRLPRWGVCPQPWCKARQGPGGKQEASRESFLVCLVLQRLNGPKESRWWGRGTEDGPRSGPKTVREWTGCGIRTIAIDDLPTVGCHALGDPGGKDEGEGSGVWWIPQDLKRGGGMKLVLTF